jgi:hypothetical protein
VTAVLRLVRDSDGGDQLPPLEAWELYMRGAGRVVCGVRGRDPDPPPSRSPKCIAAQGESGSPRVLDRLVGKPQTLCNAA